MKKLLLLLASFTVALALTGCGTNDTEDPIDNPITHDIPEEGTIRYNDLDYSTYLSDDNPVMTIVVEGMGEMKLQLFPDVAPITVDAIISYIQRGDYQDNEFHRVWSGFMIQGGRLTDPYCTFLGEMNNNSAYTGENNLSHYRGVLSMARIGGDYDSNSSQFFIVHQDSEFLDGEYTGFGGLVSGFNILDYIAPMGNQSNTVPAERVTITNITIELNGYVPNTAQCD